MGVKIKFARATSSDLVNVGIEDGKFVLAKDTGELYVDVGNQRKKVSGTVDIVSSVSSQSTNNQVPGAKLFYDTIGDINSALDLINGEII